MRDACDWCRPESKIDGGVVLGRSPGAAIVISREAQRLAETKALSRREWRTTNGNE